MGFYPVGPSSGAYALGGPIVDKAAIRLPKGKVFVLAAKNNSAQNMYILSAKLNSKPYPNSYLLRQDMVAGGTLELTMGPQPNQSFGTATANRP